MLRIPSTPPSHSIDDRAHYIAGNDPAWNMDLVKAHRELLGEANLAAHPVEIYYSGATRYSLEATMTMPDALRVDGSPATVTIEHYMLPGKRPTRFEVKQLGARDWAIASRDLEAAGFLEFAKRGLVSICDALDEHGRPATIVINRGPDGVPDSMLDSISQADRHLLGGIGIAVFNLSKNEVVSAEGKP